MGAYEDGAPPSATTARTGSPRRSPIPATEPTLGEVVARPQAARRLRDQLGRSSPSPDAARRSASPGDDRGLVARRPGSRPRPTSASTGHGGLRCISRISAPNQAFVALTGITGVTLQARRRPEGGAGALSSSARTTVRALDRRRHARRVRPAEPGGRSVRARDSGSTTASARTLTRVLAIEFLRGFDLAAPCRSVSVRAEACLQRMRSRTSILRLDTRCSKSSAKAWTRSSACCCQCAMLTISAIST